MDSFENWLEDADDQALIRSFAYGVVAEMAPNELIYFDELMTSFFANPRPPLLARSSPAERFGARLDNVIVSLTPAVGQAWSAVFTLLSDAAQYALPAEQAAVIKPRLKALLRRRPKSLSDRLVLCSTGTQAQDIDMLTVNMQVGSTLVSASVSFASMYHEACQAAQNYGIDEEESHTVAELVVQLLFLSVTDGDSRN